MSRRRCHGAPRRGKWDCRVMGERDSRGFTLVELLVVIAIIGILVSLLLPAVQAAREAARRMQCANRMRQLALAAHNYHDALNTFPPGVLQRRFPTGRPGVRGPSLFVFLLPYIEQSPLQDRLDLVDPLNNTVGGRDSVSATILPFFLCPSDVVQDNPVQNGTSDRWFGLTSYGGCSGTRSYHPQSGCLQTDGVFFMCGPASLPLPNQHPVRMADIKDGTSSTLLFGERSHFDPNYDSFAQQGWDQQIGAYGWWHTCGGFAVGDVTLSSYAPINYRMPVPFDQRDLAVPPASDLVAFQYYIDLRISAFGSQHPGGALFALADGSVRFISESIPVLTLRALSTRWGNEVVELP